MRTHPLSLALLPVALLAMMSGYASHHAANSCAANKPQSTAIASTKVYMMQEGTQNILELVASEDAPC